MRRRRSWGRWFNNKTSPSAEDEDTTSRSIATSQSLRSSPLPPGGDVVEGEETEGGALMGGGAGHRMEDDEGVDYVQIVPFDSYDFQRAKQRASFKWLLSKAYNHKTPEDLLEPFYKDHQGEEHLKPHIVKGLSDAELYCLALCNLYADPNYSQLSPWGVVQALARKGVHIPPLPDIQLTETVLIQNRPLRMVAHMAVLEAMMVLQVKEIIHAERMVSAVQRRGPPIHPREMPSDSEEAFILWINRAIIAVKEYIQNNNSREHNLSSEQVESWSGLGLCQDLSDLTDGVGLCALLGFYCEDELALSEITVPRGPGEGLSVSESLWNLQLVQRVCRDSLPYNVCHFQLEDILYFHDSMRQNMLSFLADLFNQLELNPGPNVKELGSHLPPPIRPGLTGEGVRLRRGYIRQSPISGIPDLRPSLYSCQSPASSAHNAPSGDRNSSNVKAQSATSTPKKRNNVRGEKVENSLKALLGLGDPKENRRSPSNPTLVSVPVRSSGSSHDYAYSRKSDQKDQRYGGTSSEDSEEFVVHRGRNVPTLTQLIRSVSPSSQEDRSSPGSRAPFGNRNPGIGSNSQNQMSEGEDFGIPAAGRPSNLGANKTSYAGRRSRRNSFSEADSQLTVENFGGSQDNLNRFAMKKNPDKQPAVLDPTTQSPGRHSRESPVPDLFAPSIDYRRHAQGVGQGQGQDSPSAASDPDRDRDRDPPEFHGRKKPGYSLEYNEGAGDAQSVSGRSYEKGRTPERRTATPYQRQPLQQQSYRPNGGGDEESGRSHGGGGGVTLYMMGGDDMGGGGFNDPPMRSTSLTNLSRLSDLHNKPVNIVYLQNTGTNGTTTAPPKQPDPSFGDRLQRSSSSDYRTMTMTIPSSHSRGQGQSQGHPLPSLHSLFGGRGGGGHGHPQSHHSGSQSPHSSPRSSPRNSESKSHYAPSHEGEDDTDELAAQLATIRLKLEEKRRRIETEKGRMETVASKNQFKLGKAAYLKAINKEEPKERRKNVMTDSLEVGTLAKTKQLWLKDLESKWLEKTDEGVKSPEIEAMDVDAYQRSLTKMDTSLSELESDIGRLTAQQEQIQRQFFLHGEDGASLSGGSSGKRKSWTVPAASTGGTRTYWSPPRTSDETAQSYWDPQQSTAPSPRYQNGMSAAAPSFKSSPQPPSQQPMSATTTNTSSSVSSFRLHSTAESQGHRLFGSGRPGGEDEEEGARPTPPPRQRTMHQAPLPTPPPDDMEPQSVSFVQDDNPPSSSDLTSLTASAKNSLHITSGSKTYRITPERGSPPRPQAHRLFTNETTGEESLETSEENPNSIAERGFYISLDNVAPIRPKPPLRTKSPTKRGPSGGGEGGRRDLTSEYVQSIVNRGQLNYGDPDQGESDEGSPEYYDATGSASRTPGRELVIDEKRQFDSNELDLMEKKKERILMQSLRRQQASEESRRAKENKLQRQKEEEAMKAEEKARKREEDKQRKQAILESYRIKKSEDLEKEGKGWEVQENTKRFLRPKSGPAGGRPRPKTIHLSQVDSGASSYGHSRVGSGILRRSDSQTSSSGLGRTSTNALYSGGQSGSTSRGASSVRDPWGSTSSLNQDNRRSGVNMYHNRRSRSRPRELSASRIEVSGRQPSYMGMGMGSTDYLPHRGNSTSSLLDDVDSSASDGRSGVGARRDSDSGLGTWSPPPRRSTSPPPAVKRSLPSPTTATAPAMATAPNPFLPKLRPGSLPPGLMSRQNRFDDGASEISVGSSNMDYSGLRLYKQPTSKSNRGIILNAIEYCVFPGVVNREAKMKVLDEVNRSESKHFLLMFRDAGCQFRALYTYIPETDEIVKLYGVGPRQVHDAMFEKFFKYNSGGKCFSPVHTKHLTVTIDAFTIHNALWQGKKGPAARTKDMALVI